MFDTTLVFRWKELHKFMFYFYLYTGLILCDKGNLNCIVLCHLYQIILKATCLNLVQDGGIICIHGKNKVVEIISNDVNVANRSFLFKLMTTQGTMLSF